MGKFIRFICVLLLFQLMFATQASLACNSYTGKSAFYRSYPKCAYPSVQISIADAYYGDLDKDGFNDDVFARVLLNLFCMNRHQLEYRISLTFPSGDHVSDFLRVNTETDHLTFETSFYNYATESGDYRIDVFVLYMMGGPTLSTEFNVFDPPGGAGGVGTMGTVVI